MGLLPKQAGAPDMEVNKPEAAAPVGREPSRKKYREILGEEHEGQRDGTEDHRGEEDAVDIAGGFGASITPEVQRILDSLASEIEPLREELNRVKAREKDLHDRMERHPYLPVLNRHGLEHEVSRVVGHIQGLGAAAFICVSMLNVEKLRRQYGRQIYENAMTHACEVLVSVLKSSDIVGCLGGHDLGILVLAPGEGIVGRLEHDLQVAFETRTFDCLGTSVTLNAAVGGVQLQSGQSYIGALQAADSDLLSRMKN